MATFRVGQRVRVIRSKEPKWSYLIGKEGTIEAPAFTWDWWVRIPGQPHIESYQQRPGCFLFDSDELAPLTDPKADEFIESIKRLKPYEEPKVAPKVTA